MAVLVGGLLGDRVATLTMVASGANRFPVIPEDQTRYQPDVDGIVGVFAAASTEGVRAQARTGGGAMYQQLLKEHIDDKKAYGELPQPPASPAQVQALRARAKQELGVDLPKEYYALLEVTNGLDSNGFVIYASETAPLVGYEGKNRSIEGIVEANLGWWDLEAHKQYVFLAESGMGLYVYDLKEGDYKSLDRQSNSLYEQFTSFEELIRRGLEENHP